MVTDIFDSLLQELGKIMGIPLHPGRRNSCLIKLKEGIHIQLEIDNTGEFLILGSDLGPMPPGKYRENLFKEALRSNGASPPRNGILSYSKNADHLFIFEKLPLKNLSGSRIADLIKVFTPKAMRWKEALSRGEVPVTPSTEFKGGTGIFGLHP